MWAAGIVLWKTTGRSPGYRFPTGIWNNKWTLIIRPLCVIRLVSFTQIEQSELLNLKIILVKNNTRACFPLPCYTFTYATSCPSALTNQRVWIHIETRMCDSIGTNHMMESTIACWLQNIRHVCKFNRQWGYHNTFSDDVITYMYNKYTISCEIDLNRFSWLM